MASARQKAGAKPLPLYRLYPHEYSIWNAMHQRCRNRNIKEYPYSGGRGIRVCAR